MTPRNPLNRVAGFTLVELSIVLVILGLLVGGVLAGQSLIRSAELRKFLTTHEQYKTAMLTFREKYFMLPGDLNNAKSYWPACADDGANTCNGNGDGKIVSSSHEERRVFEHLSRAGLVEGQYDGSASDIRQVSPSHLFLKTGPSYGSALQVYWDTDGWWPNSKTGHIIAYYVGSSPAVKVEEIYAFDRKVDDGNGITGQFWIIPEELAHDTDVDCIDTATGTYLMQNSAQLCTIAFYLGF